MGVGIGEIYQLHKSAGSTLLLVLPILSLLLQQIRWVTMNLQYIYTALVCIQSSVTHASSQCPHGNYAYPTVEIATMDLMMKGLEKGFDLVRCCSVPLDCELPDDLTPQQLLHLPSFPSSCSLSLIHPIENSQLPPIAITNSVYLRWFWSQ